MPDLDKILKEALDNPVLSDAADEIGKNLLEALIGELTLIPHPTHKNQNVWSARKQADQDATIHRFKDRIRNEVVRFFRHVMADGNPAAAATLDKVVFTGKSIQASIEIDKGSKERHALADFAGERVVVIMPGDVEQYFESMGEVVSSDDQGELPLDSGVSSGDGKSAPAPDDDDVGASDGGETGAAIPDEPTEQDVELALALRQNAVHVEASTVAAWDPDQVETAWNWIDDNEKDPGAVEPPAFLEPYLEQAGPSPDEPPTETVDAGTADDVEVDKRTVKALVEEAKNLADAIGEGDISKNQMKKKGREGLLDYIKYASGKLAEMQAGDDGATDSVLAGKLRKLGLEIEDDVVAGWSDDDKEDALSYADRLGSGKLPNRIPEVLIPYLTRNK